MYTRALNTNLYISHEEQWDAVQYERLVYFCSQRNSNRGADMRRRGSLEARRPRLRPDRIDDKLAAVARNVSRGSTVISACRAVGISVPSYYRWRAQRAKAPDTQIPCTRARPDSGSAAERRQIHLPSAGLQRQLGRSRSPCRSRPSDRVQPIRQQGAIVCGGRTTLYQHAVAPALVFERNGDLAAMLSECGGTCSNSSWIRTPLPCCTLRSGVPRSPPFGDGCVFDSFLARGPQRFERHRSATGGRDGARPSRSGQSGARRRELHWLVHGLCASPRTSSLKPPPVDELEKTLELCVRVFTRGLGHTGN